MNTSDSTNNIVNHSPQPIHDQPILQNVTFPETTPVAPSLEQRPQTHHKHTTPFEEIKSDSVEDVRATPQQSAPEKQTGNYSMTNSSLSNNSTPQSVLVDRQIHSPNEQQSPSVTQFTYKLIKQQQQLLNLPPGDENLVPNGVVPNINTIIDSLVVGRKLCELVTTLKEAPPSIFYEIKTSVGISILDKCFEALNANVAFEIMKLFIVNKAPALCNKHIIKVFFRLCSKVRQIHLANYIVNLFESTFNKDEEPGKESFYIINQYYTHLLLKNGEVESAFKNLHKLLANEVDDSTAKYFHKTYEIIIRHCLGANSLEDAKTLATSVLTLAKKPNDVFFNKLIDYASKSNNIAFAEFLFTLMVDHDIKPSIVTYNTLIDSYFKQRDHEKAWSLFDRLKQSEITPDNFTYTTMINGVKNQERPDLARAMDLFEEYKRVNKPDQIIYNCLLDACINSGDFTRAYTLLEEMKQQSDRIKLDEITYNTLIKGCCRSKKLMQAIAFYDEMKTNAIVPNRITYNSLIDTCVKTKKMNIAWKFYDEMQKSGIVPDNFTYSILINGIKSNNASKDELFKTLDLLDNIKDNSTFKPDEILYNSLMDACVKFGEIDRALRLFNEMQSRVIEPSSITYGILIKAYGKVNDLQKAFNIFEQIKQKGLSINEVTYGCILDACVKNDRIDLALTVVEKMKVDKITLNTILYTTLIKGFSKGGMLTEAIDMFALMKESPKTQPNVITYNCIIDACVKNDNLKKAQEIFHEMEHHLSPDLITYSTIIKGFCKKNDIETGYKFLDMMLERNIKPDEALINLILEGCYTANKIDLGLQIFAIMNDLRIVPSNITYSILIKLYGQARRLNEALDVLTTMKANGVRPSLIVYTNLVQVCLSMKRFDKAYDFFEKARIDDELRCDYVIYEKLIKGALTANRIETAAELYNQAFTEKVGISKDLSQKLSRALRESTLDDKYEWVRFVDDTMDTLPFVRRERNNNGGYSHHNNGSHHSHNHQHNYNQEKARIRNDRPPMEERTLPAGNKENIARNEGGVRAPPGIFQKNGENHSHNTAGQTYNRFKKEDNKKRFVERGPPVEFNPSTPTLKEGNERRFISKENISSNNMIPNTYTKPDFGDSPAKGENAAFPSGGIVFADNTQKVKFFNKKKAANKENQESCRGSENIVPSNTNAMPPPQRTQPTPVHTAPGFKATTPSFTPMSFR